MTIQICFAGNADLANVRTGLESLAANPNDEFVSCFMPRALVEKAGKSTAVADLFDEVLGKRMKYADTTSNTVEEFMQNLDTSRLITANSVSKLCVLDSGTAKGVAAEIAIFTNNKVVLM